MVDIVLESTGVAYGIKLSEMKKYPLNETIKSDWPAGQIITAKQMTDEITQQLKQLDCLRSIHPENKWIILQPQNGPETHIQLEKRLIQTIPDGWSLLLRYNGNGLKLLTKAIRDISAVLGVNQIPIRYFSNI